MLLKHRPAGWRLAWSTPAEASQSTNSNQREPPNDRPRRQLTDKLRSNGRSTSLGSTEDDRSTEDDGYQISGS